MKKLFIPENFLEVIKNQALSSEEEIYGWLIGYIREDVPYILAINECRRYNWQSAISAAPEAIEVIDIITMMPTGIGVVGIYHSHPFSSEIFHSHVDDSTLLSYTNQLPNCISIVTNGKEIKFYQMDENNQTQEIMCEFFEPKVPTFLLFEIEEKIEILISKEKIKRVDSVDILKTLVISKLKQEFYDIWNEMEYFSGKSKLSKSTSISKYLVSRFDDRTIKLKIPANLKKKGKISIFVGKQGNLMKSKDFIPFILKLNLKFPIYQVKSDLKLQDVEETINFEFLANNLPQKYPYIKIDLLRNEVVIPDDYFLNYFGFFIRIPYFRKKKLNIEKISQRTYDLLNNMISTILYFTGLSISSRMKSQILDFLNDGIKLSNKFYWEYEMVESLNYLKSRFELNNNQINKEH